MPHYKDIPLFKDVKEEEWNDWHWQWKNRIEDVDTLSKVIDLTPEAKEGIETALSKVKMAITPYYASLIDPDDPNCPVRMQAVPRGQEAQQRRGSFTIHWPRTKIRLFQGLPIAILTGCFF